MDDEDELSPWIGELYRDVLAALRRIPHETDTPKDAPHEH